jgi:hypothetical protein
MGGSVSFLIREDPVNIGQAKYSETAAVVEHTRSSCVFPFSPKTSMLVKWFPILKFENQVNLKTGSQIVSVLV